MLWEIEIRPTNAEVDREAERVLHEALLLGARSVRHVQSARSFLLQGEHITREMAELAARRLLTDPIVETSQIHAVGPAVLADPDLLNVMFKPGVTDNVASSAREALVGIGIPAEAVATVRKYWLEPTVTTADRERFAKRVLANDAIERVIDGPLMMSNIAAGADYTFALRHTAIRDMNDEQLQQLSKTGQLYLSLAEMQHIRQHFRELDREPTDIELETVAQTWSEHCSHKTLAGRIRYVDEHGERQFKNMLKETIFAATQTLRHNWGRKDWCVSVFKDNAGVVTFDDQQHVCFKVETHNHPSALEPYGGANTGIGGVIRDPLGTGLGARPVCNTDVFCFAPPDTPYDQLPPGVLHPRAVMKGVVSGVRDYGNRMGIPTVNGSIHFDPRYLGNPLVYCGTVAMIPRNMCDKHVSPGEFIVAVGGRTGRDGIHGATFSSAELTQDSETLSGGAVQIGNAITEKMVHDVILQARDQGLYTAITDCGAGGFSSAVGEMGAECGAEVWLDRAPLKYSGLSYTEIWISEAQERMVLSVPEASWDAFHRLCANEGVEATILGRFTDTHRLVLKYHETLVGDLSMEFLHEGRPPVVREATYQPAATTRGEVPAKTRYDEDLQRILGSLNVCSKEWVIRQYDHEVQAGSVVKPLVGVLSDGPSDAAVVQPDLKSKRGLAISNGMNQKYGDLDPYWMAAAAIDEAVRNCVAVGANPQRIAILDNFCWGNTERAETLGSLVRAALGCHDVAIAFGTPFISGKDSLNNEFSYLDAAGQKQTVAIPASLLISALGQVDDIQQCVTMDLKHANNVLLLVGATRDELGGSHWLATQGLAGGAIPRVDLKQAPLVFAGIHKAITRGLVSSCHDLSEGGLAVAVAEMAFAGGIGAKLQLAGIAAAAGLSDNGVLLFSESTTRFVLEVSPDAEAAVRECLAGLPVVAIGKTTQEPELQIIGTSGQVCVRSPLADLKAAWQAPLAWQ